ncbi:MAG: hypothetical protein QOE79_584 [Sphingomonadales bacterium]|jgi:hypothetical protein|nr:hypothetical protein [Sphingomonadales bacterium]MEA3048949.1 hypothetical protein [Sphingomonadales bacterium]
MTQFVAKKVPNGEVQEYCDSQKALGATKCEPKDNGDGTSDVLVEYPDVDL